MPGIYPGDVDRYATSKRAPTDARNRCRQHAACGCQGHRAAMTSPLLRELPRWLRPYRTVVLLLVAALVIATAAELAIGLAIRSVVDRGFSQSQGQVLDRYFLWLFGVAVVY